jgi:DNA-binding winged helix-turn-helix (wHTH) protein
MTASAAQRLSVGEWLVDPATNEISRGGERVHLEPKVVDLLLALARRAGQVVSREELLSQVWPGVVVGDDVLTQGVIKLRKALGETEHIQTIPKRGYRLIAEVGRPGQEAASPPAKSRRRLYWIAGVFILVAGATLSPFRL